MAEQQELEKYLHYLAEEDEYGNLPGWYFHDETGDLHGPFETRNETLENLQTYCDWLARHG